MIRRLGADVVRDNHCVFIGIATNDDDGSDSSFRAGDVMEINAFQKGVLKGKVRAKVADGGRFSSKQIELERGSYDIHIFKLCNKRKGADGKIQWDRGVPIVMEQAVMVGEKYPVSVMISDVNMYGFRGALVNVESNEIPLGNHDLYYRINRPGAVLEGLRYWIPMNMSTYISFFVKGVGSAEIDIPEAQSDKMQITVNS